MDEDKAEKKLDLGKLLGLAFVVFNMLVVVGGAYLVFSSTIGYKKPVTSDAELSKDLEEFREKMQQEPVIYTMESFNTNLDGLPRRLIRIQIHLEMLDAEGFEEVMNLGAGAKDNVVGILNDKTFKEIETVQGKLHLKNEIILTMNSYLNRGVVKNVYFSDFAVQ